jgi:hypothetical protein
MIVDAPPGDQSSMKRGDNSSVGAQHEEHPELHPEDDEPEIIESRISKALSDRTTKIVIILVLLMLFA